MDLSAVYDAFQSKAVANLVEDFRENPKGRYLLTIPTGGGKTFTAVKFVTQAFDQGILKADVDKVLWVAHRRELLTQAVDAFDTWAQKSGSDLSDNVVFESNMKLKSALAAHPEISFVVIDEAHHSAANSYQPAFAQIKLGILGLTATPSRTDGEPLAFERESFSIGFPDLIKHQVILKPKIVRIQGEYFTNASTDYEWLNTTARNSRIIKALKGKSFTKSIVYVGGVDHCRDLFELLKSDATIGEKYGLIGYIIGGERALFDAVTGLLSTPSRDEFIKAVKNEPRALVVNVDVLTEGYDDPAIDTVVMARPTSSKLLYMQCVGRACRRSPTNDQKQAWVVEVADELPNIRYQIDNRWLFSDISDRLEPAVVDWTIAHDAQIDVSMGEVFDHYNVPIEFRGVPAIKPNERVSVILFSIYLGKGQPWGHIPLVLTEHSRFPLVQLYNWYSHWMAKYTLADPEPVWAMAASATRIILDQFINLDKAANRKFIFDAMVEAQLALGHDNSTPSSVEGGNPPDEARIKFVFFERDDEQDDLVQRHFDFLEDLLNRDEVCSWLLDGELAPGQWLIKIPHPLAGAIGLLVDQAEFNQLKQLLQQLKEAQSQVFDVGLSTAAPKAIATAWLDPDAITSSLSGPISGFMLNSFQRVVRENYDWFRSLKIEIE